MTVKQVIISPTMVDGIIMNKGVITYTLEDPGRSSITSVTKFICHIVFFDDEEILNKYSIFTNASLYINDNYNYISYDIISHDFENKEMTIEFLFNKGYPCFTSTIINENGVSENKIKKDTLKLNVKLSDSAEHIKKIKGEFEIKYIENDF